MTSATLIIVKENGEWPDWAHEAVLDARLPRDKKRTGILLDALLGVDPGRGGSVNTKLAVVLSIVENVEGRPFVIYEEFVARTDSIDEARRLVSVVAESFEGSVMS